MAAIVRGKSVIGMILLMESEKSLFPPIEAHDMVFVGIAQARYTVFLHIISGGRAW